MRLDGTTLEADDEEVVTGVDVIVFATGFDASAPLAQFDISARGADRLKATLEAWPAAYYGMAVAGFPNMFILLGPNSGVLCVLTLTEHLYPSRSSARLYLVGQSNSDGPAM